MGSGRGLGGVLQIVKRCGSIKINPIGKVSPLSPTIYLPGQCFIHRTLDYKGIIVKSYPCHVSTNEVKELEENYVHLVFADNLDAERRANDIRLGYQYHKKMGGTLINFDLVETQEILPISNPQIPVFNDSIPLYFKQNQTCSYTRNEQREMKKLIDQSDQSYFDYEPKLKIMQYLQATMGQTIQVMKRTYKQNHESEVFTKLTCFKLQENPTGSSNWLISLRLQEMEEAKIEKAKIELFVIQDKIRQTKFQFDSISNHIIHFNDTIKLLNGEKSAFVYAIISYKKTGWPKEFRLRSNIAIIFPKRAMELLKENTKNDAGVEK